VTSESVGNVEFAARAGKLGIGDLVALQSYRTNFSFKGVILDAYFGRHSGAGRCCQRLVLCALGQCLELNEMSDWELIELLPSDVKRIDFSVLHDEQTARPYLELPVIDDVGRITRDVTPYYEYWP